MELTRAYGPLQLKPFTRGRRVRKNKFCILIDTLESKLRLLECSIYLCREAICLQCLPIDFYGYMVRWRPFTEQCIYWIPTFIFYGTLMTPYWTFVYTAIWCLLSLCGHTMQASHFWQHFWTVVTSGQFCFCLVCGSFEKQEKKCKTDPLSDPFTICINKKSRTNVAHNLQCPFVWARCTRYLGRKEPCKLAVSMSFGW